MVIVRNQGLAAYILQYDLSSDGLFRYRKDTRDYEIESSKTLEQWDILNARSPEKVHDQIVMRIRPKR